jgi:glycosyltransferase involved in cell wall biosynthesis
MKVIQWNISKKNQPISGVKRYEDELFSKLQEYVPSLDIQRIQRFDNSCIGSTFLSWLYRYTCNNADVIHATFQTLAPIAYFRKPKQFVITVHDLAPIVYPELQSDISTKIQWYLTPHALYKADKIIAISEFTKKEIIRLCGIDPGKIEVIYQGVDHTKYRPMNHQKCKEKFGLNSEETHILVVASNLPHKRMDLINKIYEMLRKEDKTIRLIKVGYGDILKGERIINLGWIKEEDMPSLYNAADLFLHAADYEGFGLPILEAMACGTSVIVNNKASFPEIVGDAGFVVDFGKENLFETMKENYMEYLIHDGERIRKLTNQSKKFTWINTAYKTNLLYQSI